MSHLTQTEVTRKSILSGKESTKTIMLDPMDMALYEKGNMLIQDAFPYLTNAEREFIKSGIDGDEWNNAFN